jgi:hypothetical protein
VFEANVILVLAATISSVVALPEVRIVTVWIIVTKKVLRSADNPGIYSAEAVSMQGCSNCAGPIGVSP